MTDVNSKFFAPEIAVLKWILTRNSGGIQHLPYRIRGSKIIYLLDVTVRLVKR